MSTRIIPAASHIRIGEWSFLTVSPESGVTLPGGIVEAYNLNTGDCVEIPPYEFSVFMDSMKIKHS